MNKKSFLIYDEWAEILINLPDAEAGQLIKMMCAWKLGQSYEASPTIQAVFAGIKMQMARDQEKWEEEKRRRAEAGKAGATARWQSHGKA